MCAATLRWLSVVAAFSACACGLETEGFVLRETGGAAGVGGSSSGSGGTTPQGGSGGTGGSGASGATGGSGGTSLGGSGGTPQGGSGGTAGSGGSGATGGSGGTAGSGGSGATGGSGGGPTFVPPWWDPSFKSRWNIQITAPSALPQGFQVPLPVQAANIDGSAAPFAAWRVARYDGSTWTELSRLIESVASTQWIWFRTEAPVTGTDTSYWLYAAHPTAPAPPSGTGVFEFYASLGQADGSTWSSTGNVSHDGTRAVLDGAGSGGSLRTNGKTFGPGFGVDFAMTVLSPLASSSYWLCGGFQRQSDFTNTSPWILWISRTPTQIDVESYITPGNWKGTSVPPSTGTEHVYSVERFPNKNVFLHDLAQKDSNTWSSSYTQALQIRFSAYNGSKIGVRWARVRKTADPPPQATLGAKQIHP